MDEGRPKAGSFLRDVIEGLSADRKTLSSKYFYDEIGDALFQQIMDLPEYYLTKSELEVFTTYKGDLLELFAAGGKAFDLIEFGAGDGMKTKVLLSEFLEKKADFRYLPVDISGNALEGLEQSLGREMPGLEVVPYRGEYFEALGSIPADDHRKKVVLFLGSNIGNFTGAAAGEFIQGISERLNPGDGVLVGLDLKKDPRIILDAYNDAQGVTRAFNLNLLQRINRELGADFMLDQFDHYPLYDPETGEARSYLVSKKEQTVRFKGRPEVLRFAKGEVIHTEISKKYSVPEIESLTGHAGLKPERWLYDCRHFYVDVYFSKK